MKKKTAININQAIENTIRAMETAASGLKNDQYPELVAVDLHDGMTYLGDIIGINVSGDILDRIFENFCIGK